MKKPLMAVVLVACSSVMVLAEQLPYQSYNQVSFDVDVQKRVANDELQATLTKSAEQSTARALANTLNTATNQVLTLAKKYPKVKVSTGHGYSHPHYNDKGKISGFFGSASIKVQSQDFEQASEFIAEAQNFMTLGGLDFGISDTTKQAVQKTLKLELIQKFHDEAALTTQAFGAKSYRLIKADLTRGGQYRSPVLMSAMSVNGAKITPQDFEGGESDMHYMATGSIELVYE